jgi:hypothetical protein
MEAHSKHFMFNKIINARNGFDLQAFLLLASLDIPHADGPVNEKQGVGEGNIVQLGGAGEVGCHTYSSYDPLISLFPRNLSVVQNPVCPLRNLLSSPTTD